MQKLQRWWRSLESMVGLAGVTSQWKSLLGPDYNQLAKYLRPNGKLAMSVPCQAKNDCGCSHFVVQHSPDHIVAACQCEPRRCDTFPITKADMAIYEVNLPFLCQSLALCFQIDCSGTRINGLYMTLQVGTYAPMAGFEFPVYLSMQVDPYDLQQAVGTLIAGCDDPFILLLPTRDLCSPVIIDMMQKNKSSLLALGDFIGIGEDGDFVAESPVETLLAKFMEQHVPQAEDQPAATFFPTPSGSTWENVSIEFVDGHRVSVKVKSESGLFNYTQMGMANKRNGEPNVQWKLLQVFAEEQGELTWRSPNADSRNQKRKEILASSLRKFFRIQGDPFMLTGDGKGWVSRFHIV